MRKILILSSLVIVVVISALFFSRSAENVSVLAEYPNKKVYTTDLALPQGPLIQDCKELEGTFNTCGTPCGPEESFCTAVCAYVCEL